MCNRRDHLSQPRVTSQPAKRTHDWKTPPIRLAFNRGCFLFAIANVSEPGDTNFLKRLKRQLLSAEAEEKEAIRKAAKEFTFDEAVQYFGLTYSPRLRDAAMYRWKIDTLPDFKNPQPSACLVSLLENYTTIYDRSSEAGCRVAVDFLLCECIAAMRGPIEDGRCTPTQWDAVKVHCEVSFTHTINPMPMTPKTIVGGRVDHGVGIVMRSKKAPNRLFHSLLLCIEAKFHGVLHTALAQLVVYLACLRQSRINRGRSNTSVYGVATDGLSYIFVTITHEGILKETRPFLLMDGDLSTVLGYLQYILETTMSMSTGLKKSGELEADDSDDLIDLDDYPSLHYDSDEQ